MQTDLGLAFSVHMPKDTFLNGAANMEIPSQLDTEHQSYQQTVTEVTRISGYFKMYHKESEGQNETMHVQENDSPHILCMLQGTFFSQCGPIIIR